MSEFGPGNPVQLFCLPYAGGSARGFAAWSQCLPAWIKVIPVELPGRGLRFGEPPPTTLPALLDDLYARMVGRLDGRPFAIYGHSLGAMLGYELILRFQRQGIDAAHFFPSGATAPHLPTRNPAYHYNDDELLTHLANLGGTPPEILDNEELMRLVLPVLRADFTIADTYVARKVGALTCPITAFGGDQDTEAPPEDVIAWRRYTRGPFTMRLLPGSHFFLGPCESELLESIESALGDTTLGDHRGRVALGPADNRRGRT